MTSIYYSCIVINRVSTSNEMNNSGRVLHVRCGSVVRASGFDVTESDYGAPDSYKVCSGSYLIAQVDKCHTVIKPGLHRGFVVPLTSGNLFCVIGNRVKNCLNYYSSCSNKYCRKAICRPRKLVGNYLNCSCLVK